MVQTSLLISVSASAMDSTFVTREH